MTVDKKTLQKIHNDACELAFEGVKSLKEKHRINSMPLKDQIEALEEIMAGFFEGIDAEKPNTREDPE